MNYRVTNTSQAGRVVYNRRRKPTEIGPGQTVEMDLDENTAGRIVTIDSGLEVEQIGEGRVRIAAKSKDADRQPRRQSNQDGSRSAQQLLDALSDKSENYPVIMAETKALVGDKWPGGVPKKDVVRELLIGAGAVVPKRSGRSGGSARAKTKG